MRDYNISRLGEGVADGVLECDLVALSGDYIATVARNPNGYPEEGMWSLVARRTENISITTAARNSEPRAVSERFERLARAFVQTAP